MALVEHFANINYSPYEAIQSERSNHYLKNYYYQRNLSLFHRSYKNVKYLIEFHILKHLIGILYYIQLNISL